MVAQNGVVESSAIGNWSKAFGELHRRIGHRFCRSEARGRTRRYLVGLLGIPVHPASLIRLAGATFMILGVVLIRT